VAPTTTQDTLAFFHGRRRLLRQRRTVHDCRSVLGKLLLLVVLVVLLVVLVVLVVLPVLPVLPGLPVLPVLLLPLLLPLLLLLSLLLPPLDDRALALSVEGVAISTGGGESGGATVVWEETSPSAWSRP
jgi:hypothetical protein